PLRRDVALHLVEVVVAGDLRLLSQECHELVADCRKVPTELEQFGTSLLDVEEDGAVLTAGVEVVEPVNAIEKTDEIDVVHGNSLPRIQSRPFILQVLPAPSVHGRNVCSD